MIKEAWTSNGIRITWESNDENVIDKSGLIKELTRLECFLKATEIKLNNELFLKNAKPEIIERERNKKYDTEKKIRALKSAIHDN